MEIIKRSKKNKKLNDYDTVPKLRNSMFFLLIAKYNG